MTDFFDDMAAMARDILKPSNQGGLGAKSGSLKYVRYVSGPPPSNPWEAPPTPIRIETGVNGQAFGVSKQLVGTTIDNTVLVSTDLYAILPVIYGDLDVSSWWEYYFLPSGADEPNVTHVLEVNDNAVTILGIERIPAAGIASAVKFFVRK